MMYDPSEMPSYRTRPCKYFNNGRGYCSKDKCTFKHSIDDGECLNQQAYIQHAQTAQAIISSRMSDANQQLRSLSSKHFEDDSVDEDEMVAAAEALEARNAAEAKQELEEEPVSDDAEDSQDWGDQEDPEEEIVERSTVETWIDDVRAEVVPPCIPRDTIHIEFPAYNFDCNRKYGETVYLPIGPDSRPIEMIIGNEVDLSWCCMLYGKEAKVANFATQAMLLGYQLNTELKPALAEKGYSFRNIMFITEDALDEPMFKAIAHFWSIQLVSLPEVHKKLKQQVSNHLKDADLDPRHVFLKAYAWKQKSRRAIISDLDILITSGEALGASLSTFLDPQHEHSKLLESGGVAVMDRKASRIDFNCRQWVKPKLIKPQEGSPKRQLSYCMALLKPDKQEADRYFEELQKDPGSKVSKLSDQWFLNEFLRKAYVLLPMNLSLIHI